MYMTDTTDIEQKRKKGKRTAIILAVVALAFYVGFFYINLQLSS